MAIVGVVEVVVIGDCVLNWEVIGSDNGGGWWVVVVDGVEK